MSTERNGDTFTCSACGETFPFEDDDEWSEADAIAEREREFPGWAAEQCNLVCDPCYKGFQEWRKANTQ